jgi:hypothetical protein
VRSARSSRRARVLNLGSLGVSPRRGRETGQGGSVGWEGCEHGTALESGNLEVLLLYPGHAGQHFYPSLVPTTAFDETGRGFAAASARCHPS